jgi:pyruvate formate lyase activating enzyme
MGDREMDPKQRLRALVTNVQGFSTEDGPGIRTTVFFKGCPLRCPWCHNPEGLHPRPELIFYQRRCIGCKECKKVCPHGAPIPGGPKAELCEGCFKCVQACPAAARETMGKWYGVDELTALVLRDRVYYETSGGGVTASGGEAMLWPEFIAEFFRRLKQEGIPTALDTSGVVGGDKLRAVLAHTDLALVDLKIMDPVRHQRIIGVELAPILEHIHEIDESGTRIFIRVPLIPGYTDDGPNLRAIAGFVGSLRHCELVDLLPYHRMATAKYQQLGLPYPLAQLTAPTEEMMDAAQRAFTAAGIKAIIAGRDEGPQPCIEPDHGN